MTIYSYFDESITPDNFNFSHNIGTLQSLTGVELSRLRNGKICITCIACYTTVCSGTGIVVLWHCNFGTGFKIRE